MNNSIPQGLCRDHNHSISFDFMFVKYYLSFIDIFLLFIGCVEFFINLW